MYRLRLAPMGPCASYAPLLLPRGQVLALWAEGEPLLAYSAD